MSKVCLLFIYVCNRQTPTIIAREYKMLDDNVNFMVESESSDYIVIAKKTLLYIL